MPNRRSPQNTLHRRQVCAVALFLVIPLGLLCRFAPIGLPYVLVKYGGSFLWAMAVYWFIAFVAARQRPFTIAAIAAVATAIVEFIKRIPSAHLDAFRDTFAGKILLGRYFSFRDIAVYYAAILCALWIDGGAIHRRSASKE